MPAPDEHPPGLVVRLAVTPDVRRRYRRRMWRCQLRRRATRLATIALVLAIGAVIVVSGATVGVVLLAAGVLLLALQLRAVDAGATSLSRVVKRDEVSAELGAESIRILRQGAATLELPYCEIVGPLRRDGDDGVAVTFTHVVDGHGHWPAGLVTPQAQRFLEARTGPRDLARSTGPVGAHDVVVGRRERDQLVAALRRHHVLFAWRRWAPVSAMLVVVGLVVGSWPVVAFGLVFVLLSPVTGLGSLARRVDGVYPVDSTVRSQVLGERLVVDTATYRYAIEPAAVDAVVRRGPLLLVQHHTDDQQHGDVLHQVWLDAPARAFLDRI